MLSGELSSCMLCGLLGVSSWYRVARAGIQLQLRKHRQIVLLLLVETAEVVVVVALPPLLLLLFKKCW